VDLRFPAPLRPGARVGVTSPSAGVSGAGAERIDFCVGWLRERGYDVVVGDCMNGSRHVSAPREQRATELTAMLTDPAIQAVVPPWGGETLGSGSRLVALRGRSARHQVEAGR
jgi:muramoyltetrapeptide carboxypeptidase